MSLITCNIRLTCTVTHLYIQLEAAKRDTALTLGLEENTFFK